MKTDKAYGIAINQGGTADISDIRPWQRQMISARDFLLYFYFLFECMNTYYVIDF